MKNIIANRMFIILSALKDNILYRIVPHDGKSSKIVLIVFQQVFGDAIILSGVLSEYAKLFSKEQGYRLIMLARPSIISFIKDVLPVPEEIEFEPIDFTLFLENYSYYRKIMKTYGSIANMTIVPGTSLSGEIFTAASHSERKVGLGRSISMKHPFIMWLFSKIAYTELLHPPVDLMMLQRHRFLVNYLGGKQYKAKLPTLLPQNRYIEQKYCVICPGSSAPEKCWPIERYNAIIKYMITQYDLDICICGGKDEIEFADRITFETSRIHNFIGNTTFKEWSSVVQHAELVVGNDSATMHLAVAARRRAVCISGVYDECQYFPYRLDELNESDRLPVTIIKNMPCKMCRAVGYYVGFGNSECKKRIEEKKCALCIDKVTVTEVREAIDLLMKEAGYEFA